MATHSLKVWGSYFLLCIPRVAYFRLSTYIHDTHAQIAQLFPKNILYVTWHRSHDVGETKSHLSHLIGGHFPMHGVIS